MNSTAAVFQSDLTVWDSHVQRREFDTILNSTELFFLAFCEASAKTSSKYFKITDNRKIESCTSETKIASFKKLAEFIRKNFLDSFKKNENVQIEVKFINETSDDFQEHYSDIIMRLPYNLGAYFILQTPILKPIKNRVNQLELQTIGYKFMFNTPNKLIEKLYQKSLKGEECDVTLISSEGVAFRVHSCVLNSIFPNFFPQEKHVRLPHGNFVCRTFVDYLYLGKQAFFKLEDEELVPFTELLNLKNFADQYNVPEFKSSLDEMISKD